MGLADLQLACNDIKVCKKTLALILVNLLAPKGAERGGFIGESTLREALNYLREEE